MKKETFELVKKELKYIALLFLLAVIIFKIVFLKENLIIVFRNVFALFWLFVLPGYFVMLYWSESLEFIERIIVGTGASAAIIGIFSYYFGLLGLNIKYHGILMPLVLILIGIILMYSRPTK